MFLMMRSSLLPRTKFAEAIQGAKLRLRSLQRFEYFLFLHSSLVSSSFTGSVLLFLLQKEYVSWISNMKILSSFQICFIWMWLWGRTPPNKFTSSNFRWLCLAVISLPFLQQRAYSIAKGSPYPSHFEDRFGTERSYLRKSEILNSSLAWLLQEGLDNNQLLPTSDKYFQVGSLPGDFKLVNLLLLY